MATSGSVYSATNSSAVQTFVELFVVPGKNSTKCNLDGGKLKTSFVLWSAIPACLLIVATSFIHKRKELCLSCAGGRPGVNYPIDLLHDNSRRWANAAVFGIITSRLMLIIFSGTFYFSPPEFGNRAWMEKYSFTKALVGMFNVFLVVLDFYPFLVFLTLRRNILLNICGIIYSGVWLIPIIASITKCSMVGNQLTVILQLIRDIPVVVCHFLVGFAYVYDFVRNLFCLLRLRDKTAALQYSFLHGDRLQVAEHYEYVKALMTRRVTPKPSSFKGRLIRALSYKRVPGFRYSARMICTMTVASLVLYQVIVQVVFMFSALLILMERKIEQLGQLVDSTENKTSSTAAIRDAFNILTATFHVSNVIATLVTIFTIVHVTLVYRKHVTQLIRGDRSWFSVSPVSPANNVVACWRYSGYQIVSLLYGYTLQLFVMWFLLFLISYFLILPLRDGYQTWVTRKIRTLWPTVVVSLVLYYMQLLAAKYIFLDQNGANLALVNRRVYHVVSYFLFFSNVLLGLFAICKRVILSLIFGLILINRQDRCVLMRGFESHDNAFKSYLGMLEVEIYHNHPILRVFCDIVRQHVKRSRKCAKQCATNEIYRKVDPERDSNGSSVSETASRSRTVRMRWYKAITLVHNPIVLLERLERKARQAQQAIGKAEAKANKVDKTTKGGTGNGCCTSDVAISVNGADSSEEDAKQDAQAAKYELQSALDMAGEQLFRHRNN